MVSDAGRTAASLNFPVTFPPQPMNGYLVPGFVSGRHLRRAITPPQLFPELKALPGFDVHEVAWDLDMEKKAIQTLPKEYEYWSRLPPPAAETMGRHFPTDAR